MGQIEQVQVRVYAITPGEIEDDDPASLDARVIIGMTLLFVVLCFICFIVCWLFRKSMIV